MKVASCSALRTGRLYPPEYTVGTHFCQRLSDPKTTSGIEPAVPQPTAPPPTPFLQTVDWDSFIIH